MYFGVYFPPGFDPSKEGQIEALNKRMLSDDTKMNQEILEIVEKYEELMPLAALVIVEATIEAEIIASYGNNEEQLIPIARKAIATIAAAQGRQVTDTLEEQIMKAMIDYSSFRRAKIKRGERVHHNTKIIRRVAAENYTLARRSADQLVPQLPDDAQAFVRIALENDMPAFVGINVYAAMPLIRDGLITTEQIADQLASIHAQGIGVRSAALVKHIKRCVDNTVQASLNLSIDEASYAHILSDPQGRRDGR